MPSRELQIIATLKDNVSKQLGGISGKLKANQASFKKMAMVGTAALAGLAYGAKKTIDAFQKQERAEERLAHLTKLISNATDEQVQSLKDQAAALQKVGVIGDEVVMMGQSQLATFALTTDQIKLLTPSLMDMAVATKGVNATQEDMINIGNALGRAIDGGAGALTRYGISLTDTQKDLYTVATREERVAMLAEILQGNFGGLNEATRKTSEGGMKALQNTLGDVSESIGGALVPMLNDLVKRLQPVIENILNWVRANPELIKKILIATAAIAAIVTVVGILGLVLPSIIGGFGLLATAIAFIVSPIGLVILAIAALVAAGLYMRNHWEEIKDGWNYMWEIMGEKVDNVIASIKNRVMGVVNWITEKFNMIKNIPSKIFGGASSFLGKIGIPGFAEGGIVTSPTLATVGESGAEAIIPLSKMGGIGSRIIININSPIYGMEARDVADKLANTILGNLRSQYKL